MPPEEFEEVLRFWFPRYLSDDHAATVHQFEWWFRSGADSAIAERFAPQPERATRGELGRWTHRTCGVRAEHSLPVLARTVGSYRTDPATKSKNRKYLVAASRSPPGYVRLATLF
jgi:uncharacterized protein (DUF924 family)